MSVNTGTRSRMMMVYLCLALPLGASANASTTGTQTRIVMEGQKGGVRWIHGRKSSVLPKNPVHSMTWVPQSFS